MSSPYLGEIRIFAGNFAPKGWAFCNGQLLSIAQNTALFSLLGTYYGGNGTTTFALPNLQSRVPIHAGQGPGLSLYDIGQTGGEETVTLLSSEMPVHTHSLAATDATGTSSSPQGAYMAKASSGRAVVDAFAPASALTAMSSQSTDYYGSGQAHDNMSPVLALSFIIATQGVFPARN